KSEIFFPSSGCFITLVLNFRQYYNSRIFSTIISMYLYPTLTRHWLHSLGLQGFLSVQKYILFLVGSEDLNKKIPFSKKGLSTVLKYETREKFKPITERLYKR